MNKLYVLTELMLMSTCLRLRPLPNKLIAALRTAMENGEDMLNKEATSHDESPMHSGSLCSFGTSGSEKQKIERCRFQPS